MKKRKLLALMLTAAMTAAALAGCGSDSADSTANADGAAQSGTESAAEAVSEPAAAETEATGSVVTEPTEITFIFADGDEAAKEAITNVVNAFNESHEDITVTIEPGNGGTYDEFLKTKESVGEFPDVMEMRNVMSYVRAGKVAPLSEEITSLFSTNVDVDGEVYVAPFTANLTAGIIYNKAYFEENGLEEPSTYEEFLKLCETIEGLGDMTPIVVGGADVWHMGFWFHKAFCDQVYSVDEDFIEHCYEGTASFTDDCFKAAFTELGEVFQYVQDGWTSTSDSQITTFLVNDMAAMMYSQTHMFANIEEADPEFEYGWFTIPSPDGKLRLQGGASTTGLSISAEAAQDPNRLAACEEFIKFFYDPAQYKGYLETVSGLPTTAEDPQIEVSDVMQEVIDDTNAADELGAMWNARIGNEELPADFRNYVYKTLIEYLQGSKDLDTCVQEIQTTWDNAIVDFNPVTGVGIE